MRVDKGSQTVEFDNMQDRPLKGTAGWKKFGVVLDVPQDATGVFFVVLLDSAGKVWLSEVKFEVVGTDVPTTGIRPQAPAVRPGQSGFSTTIKVEFRRLFVAQGFDGLQARGLERRPEAADNSDKRQDDERDHHHPERRLEKDVALMVGRLVELAIERHRRDGDRQQP